MAELGEEVADDTTEVVDFEQDENEVELGPPSAEESLRYFGVDFDVEGLVRRFKRGELIIPRFDPEEPATEETGYLAFQRNFVWKKKQMDRFVESILLGYPVPGIFLVELQTRQYVVLDGQQRLTTLHDFYEGKYRTPNGDEREFALDYAADGQAFKGQTYEQLQASDQRLLNNALIQATVVLPTGDKGKLAVYALFERINSGGTKLNEQQIRVAIFPGTVTQAIREMNKDENWRKLFGPVHRDLKDQELILRYLALKDVAANIATDDKAFKPPLATFMSTFLDKNDEIDAADIKREAEEFSVACRLLVEAAGEKALRRDRSINAARADSILSGLTLAIRSNPSITVDAVRQGLASLESDVDFRESTEKSTSHRASVNTRLRAALKAFAKK